jgi:polysaccharide chain length determinant protein (PEP-CTERM system associated)
LQEAENQVEQFEVQLEDDEDSYLLYSELQPEMGSAIDMRIQNLQERMEELLLRYTEKHPDVVEITRLIEELKIKREEDHVLMDDMDLGPVDNPVYQQLKMQLTQAEANVASMNVRVAEYERRIGLLQERVDSVPKIEAELKQLDRDYGIHKQNYQALLSRRESANMAEQAEISGDQLKFRVIDPPRVPIHPSSPNRPLLMTAVLISSIAAGVVFAFFLYLLRPTFDSARAIVEVLGRPVLGGVSMIHNQEWSKKHRRALVAYSIAGVGLLLLYGGALTLNGLELNMAALKATIVGRS